MTADAEPIDEAWTITRPCCGQSGALRRPANGVRIPHTAECRRRQKRGEWGWWRTTTAGA